MRLLVLVAVLSPILCLSACAASSPAEKVPQLANQANAEAKSADNKASLPPTPSPTAKTAVKPNGNQAKEQLQCSKEFRNETVTYKDLPKDVKVEINETAKNKYSEFSLLVSTSIDDPNAKEPKCQTYYDYSTSKDINGDEIPEKQNIGWRFIQVREHWKYVPPYNPNKKQR